MKQIIALFAVFAAISAGAQEFQDITPGADLAGWKVISGDWSVKDGVLTGRAKPGEEAIIIGDREYADAELELDVQAEAPFLASVYLRGHALPKLPLPEGAAIAAAPRDIQGCGASVQHAEGSTTTSISGFSTAFKPEPGSWATLGISAQESKVTVTLAHKGSRGVSGPTTPYVKGHVAFVVRERQDGQPSEMKFRNVKVKDLGRLGTWRPLFNGKDLDGWVEWGQEKWSVEDGVIWGRSGEKKSEGYLATKDTWKDFHVRGTFKMAGEGNFGLFYHSTIKYDEKQYPVISGVQGEVAPADPNQGNASPSGWIYESYKRGWLVEPDMKSPAAFALKPTDWNEIEIKSEGSHIQTWINGIPVVDWTDPAPNLTEGAFALQLHTGGVDGIAWKDLYVKE
ncbi:MAG: DUF1080 domain-containing protein [Candidatus Hydrogenedentes bacterium]|nr:DUF1080 domain-containing protein [Candidatus Hydrogenedentota bacterium]